MSNSCYTARQRSRRIFEPGFTTKGSRVGMGLGLLIARQIVERHRGSIRVHSTVGVGSTFEVRVPRRFQAVEPGRGKTETIARS